LATFDVGIQTLVQSLPAKNIVFAIGIDRQSQVSQSLKGYNEVGVVYPSRHQCGISLYTQQLFTSHGNQTRAEIQPFKKTVLDPYSGVNRNIAMVWDAIGKLAAKEPLVGLIPADDTTARYMQPLFRPM
jgi:hypothetical protein